LFGRLSMQSKPHSRISFKDRARAGRAANIAKLPEMPRNWVAQGLNASFIKAAQRDNAFWTRIFVWMGKDMKAMAVVGRAGVYEAIALVLFAGMVVLFVHAIVPLIAD
jgi:hypothetical protein